MRKRPSTVMLGLAFCCLTAASPALGAQTTLQQLADRYNPALYVEPQQYECGPGEAYRPTSVEIVLNREGVVLRDAADRVVRDAPSAADLFGLGPGYYLDLPGDPLNPGCTYERAYRAWSAGTQPLVYAHVAYDDLHPGSLALQYWFYYLFNDFTDLHESDWEMLQLDFHASSPAQALSAAPYEIDLAQHAGGERAPWESHAVRKDGTHPVIYVATGSQATYLGRELYLGRSASEGFGCDDTRAASERVPLQTVVLPDVPQSRDSPFAWLGFFGRWGQKEPGFNNGPTGPADKLQWSHPIEWSQSLRDSSVVVPTLPTLGTSVTSFFCGAVQRGARFYNWALQRPWVAGLVLALVLALLAVSARRTTWRPPAPVPVLMHRRGGQILRASARLYWRRRWTFVGIGLIFIPVSVLCAGVQWVLFHLTGASALVALDGRQGPVTAWLALLIGGLGAAIASVLATAAVALVLRDLADGGRLTALGAYRQGSGRLRALLGATGRELGAVALLSLTVIGIPLAIWLFVRWSLFAEACVWHRLRARESLHSSARLISGHWWRTAGFTLVVDGLVALTGPLVGVALLLLTSRSLAVINLTGGIVYALTVPYAAIALTLYYLDLELGADPGTPPQATPFETTPG